jgi:F-type H+-transporting ATPase subunit delta
MHRVGSAKRYAQAAFELALEKGELESAQVGLNALATIVTDSKLMGLLENPNLPFATKRDLLKEALGKVDPLVLNVAGLLMSRGILRSAGDISQHYGRLLNAHYGIEHAEVVTAVHLDDKHTRGLSSRFAEMVGHSVIVDARVDPSIVGGFRARIGDMLIDASIRNTLEFLRKNLALAGR